MSITILPIPLDSDFSPANIPFGVFRDGETTSGCSRIGDYIIDLHVCQEYGIFEDLRLPKNIFFNRPLNDFMSLGKEVTKEVRQTIMSTFILDGQLAINDIWPIEMFRKAGSVQMVLPITIGDYTDFYSSKEHATNVGIMFRDPKNALLPNWLHIPVGYHGRSSSIVVSGTEVHRPNGQTIQGNDTSPTYGPSRQVDFELEMAFVIGKNSGLGQPIGINEAESYIFGLMLFNDWSARDIQKWEYVPLGPFLAKNFASTLSPWIITMESLEPFKVEAQPREKPILPYLESSQNCNYDIHLEVAIETEGNSETVVTRSNFKYLYWSMIQQLAHHTVNGCNVRVGDLLASGTISGPHEGSYGSMLEIAWKGTKPVPMKDGTTRIFIQDGDTVKLKGWAGNGSSRVGFGECEGKLIPALNT
ncbi:MAG: fumarylacetoacetase [Lewinellaceae bacterium]|nr:fumarylacetoacetase [Lewinellaceae bacterium]